MIAFDKASCFHNVIVLHSHIKYKFIIFYYYFKFIKNAYFFLTITVGAFIIVNYLLYLKVILEDYIYEISTLEHILPWLPLFGNIFGQFGEKNVILCNFRLEVLELLLKKLVNHSEHSEK